MRSYVVSSFNSEAFFFNLVLSFYFNDFEKLYLTGKDISVTLEVFL